jgi:hypothetical protein
LKQLGIFADRRQSHLPNAPSVPCPSADPSGPGRDRFYDQALAVRCMRQSSLHIAG